MINIAKAAVATVAATTAVGLALTAAPTAAHATPITSQKASTAKVKHPFGETVTVDGFNLTAIMEPDVKHNHRFTEEINIYITPTKHHKKWTPTESWNIHYGKHRQHTPKAFAGQGFGSDAKAPYMAGGLYTFGKHHAPKHVQYTFTLRGHKILWTND